MASLLTGDQSSDRVAESDLVLNGSLAHGIQETAAIGVSRFSSKVSFGSTIEFHWGLSLSSRLMGSYCSGEGHRNGGPQVLEGMPVSNPIFSVKPPGMRLHIYHLFDETPERSRPHYEEAANLMPQGIF